MNQHRNYHYSITIQTHDEAVLHCLRALSQYAQIDGNKRIPWGGTKKQDWELDDHKATFHFSRTEYRNNFTKETKRLLPENLFKIEKTSDNDPAQPQNSEW